VDQSIVDQLPQLHTVSELDTFPSLEEISAAANNLKNNKAPGRDGIPVEIFKYGGNLLSQRLHSFISTARALNDSRDLFIAFIDLTKVFDTVNRGLLWRVLGKFGCPAHFLSIL